MDEIKKNLSVMLVALWFTLIGVMLVGIALEAVDSHMREISRDVVREELRYHNLTDREN